MKEFIVTISDEEYAKRDADTQADIMRSEIVRCDDCKYYDLTDSCKAPHWDLSDIQYPKVENDDFCSFGERREP